MAHLSATPAKLRDGTWGARCAPTAQPGDTLTVRAKSGKTWDATVSRVVATFGDAALVATGSSGVAARPSSPSRSRSCAECGQGAGVVPRRDSSGLSGMVCRRCSSIPASELSFA